MRYQTPQSSRQELHASKWRLLVETSPVHVHTLIWSALLKSQTSFSFYFHKAINPFQDSERQSDFLKVHHPVKLCLLLEIFSHIQSQAWTPEEATNCLSSSWRMKLPDVQEIKKEEETQTTKDTIYNVNGFRESCRLIRCYSHCKILSLLSGLLGCPDSLPGERTGGSDVCGGSLISFLLSFFLC